MNIKIIRTSKPNQAAELGGGIQESIGAKTKFLSKGVNEETFSRSIESTLLKKRGHSRFS
jgi:hypothetical protein